MVAFNLGVAELWAGDPKDAQADLRHAKQLDPYGFYGERADNALHYTMARGYPFYIPPSSPRTRPSVAELRSQTSANPGDSAAWLQLAVELQRTHRAEAIEAARKAVEASPTAVSPRVALAVLTFDKDHPATSMGALGPLLQQQESNTEIRFHVGLLAYWLGSTTQALGEFRQVLRDDPHGPYSELSRQLIDKLDPAAMSRVLARCRSRVVPPGGAGRGRRPGLRTAGGAGGELHRPRPAGRGDQSLQRAARAERAQPTLTAPSYSLEYQPLSESMRTEVPVCGAWMKRPPPM